MSRKSPKVPTRIGVVPSPSKGDGYAVCTHPLLRPLVFTQLNFSLELPRTRYNFCATFERKRGLKAVSGTELYILFYKNMYVNLLIAISGCESIGLKAMVYT